MSQGPSSRARAIRLIAGLLLPLIAFVVLVRSLGNATEALAITDAIPMLWVIAFAIWRRRIEPIGAIAVAVSAIALLLTIALGGSSLPLELHRAVFPGAAGLACLISLAARWPLLSIASTKLARARPEATAATRPKLDSPGAYRLLITLTAIIGVTLVADAAAQVALALTVSASTFGVVTRIASWVIVGTGLAVCVLYARWTLARLRHDRTPAPRSEPTPQRGPTGPSRAGVAADPRVYAPGRATGASREETPT